MGLIDALRDLLSPEADETAGYACDRCGAECDRPDPPCDECGWHVLTPLD
jgi:hypothetical protein